MSAERPIGVLIGALGGQGGGVLADWLTEAARISGFPAQSTSTPGVAQRTGATSYYFELFPEKNPTQPPLFALFPAADDVDLMAALEPTEAGRALDRGYVTKRTTVITATERLYSTAEKVAAGDGTIATGPVLDALQAASQKLMALPMRALSDGAANQANAILLGAIAASGILPIPADDFRAAITGKGVAVAPNLAGFEIGIGATGGEEAPDDGKTYSPAPDGFDADLAVWDEALRPLIGHCLARLTDYQDANYARLFLTRMQTISGTELREETASRLAAWMSFEDVIRVAQLKTRPGRLARIRSEIGIDADAPLKLQDFFKPGHEEITGFLPPWLAAMIPGAKSKRRAGEGLTLRWPTGNAFGYAALKFLGALKFLRPGGNQYANEQRAIEQWLGAVTKAADIDTSLAVQTARLAIWARGYGDVRSAGLKSLADLFINWDQQLQVDLAGLKVSVDQSLLLAHANPDAPAH